MFAGSQASQLRPRFIPHRPAKRRHLNWARAEGVNIAKIHGGVRDKREWRDFLDHLRPSSRPLVLWLEGRVWIGSEGRAQLAAAIGSSEVALVVNDDIGRGLATALRWLGVKVTAYSASELEQLDTELDLDPGVAGQLIDRLY